MDKGEGRSIKIFRIFFVSQCRKIRKGPLWCFTNFGYRKCLDERLGGGGGECQDFPSKISRLTVPKNFVGQPFSVSLFSGIEKC